MEHNRKNTYECPQRRRLSICNISSVGTLEIWRENAAAAAKKCHSSRRRWLENKADAKLTRSDPI